MLFNFHIRKKTPQVPARTRPYWQVPEMSPKCPQNVPKMSPCIPQATRRTVVGKLVIAIGEVVWPPETANMFKRLLNLVGVTRSMRLSYTSSRSSEYDQKWCSSSKHNDDCPCVEVSSITLYHFITPLIVANIMEGVIGGVVIRMGQISP